MIKEYPTYFQKSLFFLYPLLDIKTSKIFPENTFLILEGYIEEKDCKILCSYDNKQHAGFSDFEKNNLLSSKYFIEKIEIDDLEKAIYIFNLEDYCDDYQLFINGEYSKMSNDTKMIILNFYKFGTLQYEYIKSFLYPSKYYEVYADVLNVDIKILKSNIELVSKYEPEKETFLIEVKDLDISI
jgi:hypothetical protein